MLDIGRDETMQPAVWAALASDGELSARLYRSYIPSHSCRVVAASRKARDSERGDRDSVRHGDRGGGWAPSTLLLALGLRLRLLLRVVAVALVDLWGSVAANSTARLLVVVGSALASLGGVGAGLVSGAVSLVVSVVVARGDQARVLAIVRENIDGGCFVPVVDGRLTGSWSRDGCWKSGRDGCQDDKGGGSKEVGGSHLE